MSLSRVIRWVLILGIIALCSCGGGNGLAGTGGVGSGGTGIISGTVTGLASIVIDGQDIQEGVLPVAADGIEGPDQTEALSQLQMGAQMQINLAQGQPQSLTVRIQLAGPVQSLTATGLIVQGLPVRINTNPAAGPMTFFAGVSGLAGLQVGQQVAVSGSYGEDAQGSYLVATRIALHVSAPYQVITGIVNSVGAGQITLNHVTWSLATAGSLSSVVSGSRVTLWVDANQQVVKVVPLGLQGQADSAQLTGIIYNISGQTFWVQGTEVLMQGGLPATLTNGVAVTVQGSLSDGVVQAQTVQVYSSSASTVLLQGNVSQYISPGSMEVRGVPVDASTARVQGGLADGVFVQVQGTIQGNHVQASTVTVTTPPLKSILTQQCVVTQIGQNSLSCQPAQGSAPVQLSWTNPPPVRSTQGAMNLSAVSTGQTILYDGQLTGDGAIQTDSLQILSDHVVQATPPNQMPASQLRSIQGVIYGFQASAATFSLNNLNFVLAQGVVAPADLGNGDSVELAFVPGPVNQVVSIAVDH